MKDDFKKLLKSQKTCMADSDIAQQNTYGAQKQLIFDQN
jgi:hypothetical protein